MSAIYHWLISYDIVEDRTRNRVFKFLKNIAVPLQGSVFCAKWSYKKATANAVELEKLIDSKCDLLWLHPLDKNHPIIGQKPLWPDSLDFPQQPKIIQAADYFTTTKRVSRKLPG